LEETAAGVPTLRWLAQDTVSTLLRPRHYLNEYSVRRPQLTCVCRDLSAGGSGADHRRRTDGEGGTGLDASPLQQLLTHTCGGWSSNGNDPLEKPAMNLEQLIAWRLWMHLSENPPGDKYA